MFINYWYRSMMVKVGRSLIETDEAVEDLMDVMGQMKRSFDTCGIRLAVGIEYCGICAYFLWR